MNEGMKYEWTRKQTRSFWMFFTLDIVLYWTFILHS